MILNICSRIHIYCGCHDKPIKMVPHEGTTVNLFGGGSTSMFYSCPKYYEDNRAEDEKACFNRLSISEYEGMVNEICRQIEENSGNINLAGYTWKNKQGTKFHVFRDDPRGIDISVESMKAKR